MGTGEPNFSMGVPPAPQRAPTRADRPFHNVKHEYGENTLRKALAAGQITAEDAQLIRAFVAELTVTNGIGLARVNKITTVLCMWRRILGPYQSNTITDIYRAIGRIRDTPPGGRPFKQNTIRDYISFLKRFYVWLVINNYSTCPIEKVKKIRVPNWDSMTMTAEQLLTDAEILRLIQACQSSRDRAIIATLAEGGFRIAELGTLTWGQVKFDEYGVIANVNSKTERPRFVRLVASSAFLASWKNDYPCEISDDSLVFISAQKKPLNHALVLAQLKKIARRAGITKHVHPHLFRHSRITAMLRDDYPESVIKQIAWGNPNSKMLSTYGHLTQSDIDNVVLERQGIKRVESQKTETMKARQCPHCYSINGPISIFCQRCGRPLTAEAEDSIEQITKEIEAHPLYKSSLELLKQKLLDEVNRGMGVSH